MFKANQKGVILPSRFSMQDMGVDAYNNVKQVATYASTSQA